MKRCISDAAVIKEVSGLVDVVRELRDDVAKLADIGCE
jgi:hypothetical protein